MDAWWQSGGVQNQVNTRLRLTDCRLRLMMDAWEESKHPRRKDGKFGEGGGAVEENSEIEPEFTVMRTLSAMAKKFYVKTGKPLRDEGWFLKEGSTVTGVSAIAVGKKIRDVTRLVNEYKKQDGTLTNPNDWIKARGTAIVEKGNETCSAEVHWYQCKEIGKIDFKMKLRGEKEDVITV